MFQIQQQHLQNQSNRYNLNIVTITFLLIVNLTCFAIRINLIRLLIVGKLEYIISFDYDNTIFSSVFSFNCMINKYLKGKFSISRSTCAHTCPPLRCTGDCRKLEFCYDILCIASTTPPSHLAGDYGMSFCSKISSSLICYPYSVYSVLCYSGLLSYVCVSCFFFSFIQINYIQIVKIIVRFFHVILIQFCSLFLFCSLE